MSTSITENEERMETGSAAETTSVASPETESNPNLLSEEDQLWHLKAKIRSEYPNGFHFIGADGTLKSQLWVLVDIIGKSLPLPSGGTHEGYVVRVRRMSGEGETEEYPLGDFMERRLARSGDKR